MISRKAEAIIHKLVRGFPVVAINGPRQSGKTTLVKSCFPLKPYVSLENPDILELALTDPKGFLQNYRSGGIILDEVQRAPQIFSYLQAIEIKAGATLNSDYFRHLNKWDLIAGNPAVKTLIYSGDSELTTKGIQVLRWSNEKLFRPLGEN